MLFDHENNYGNYNDAGDNEDDDKYASVETRSAAINILEFMAYQQTKKKRAELQAGRERENV